MSAANPTVADLFREWKIVRAKLTYDIACLPEEHADAVLDALCDAARNRMHEIEDYLGSRTLTTPGEMRDVLDLALLHLENEAEATVDDRDLRLLSAVRSCIADLVHNARTPA